MGSRPCGAKPKPTVCLITVGFGFAPPGREPILSTCDGHDSNMTLEVAVYMRSNMVSLAALPAHHTAVMQECDASRGPISEAKKVFSQLVRRQMRVCNRISSAQIAGLWQMAVKTAITAGML